ncbi:MAG TPA: AAA family ATPase, partial [Polyangiaceae bacterium]|nr:AAA family ATPase [Polyangiaceae bacterium]
MTQSWLGKLPERLSARFEVLGSLGAGGMGVVQRAFDRQLGREVAVKSLPASDPSLLYSLKEEFRAVASLTHPNLVQYFELFVADTDCFLTMEIVEGLPLVDYVRQGWTAKARATESGIRFRASMPESVQAEPAVATLPSAGHEPEFGPVLLDDGARSRFSSVSLQLITAVAALHDAGRLHCDIKPSNVLITEQGRLVLLDFGLSLPRSGPLKRQGFAGTLAYAAPEQFWEGDLTEATDWYAVGLVLYKALTGTLPGDDVQQLVRHEPEHLHIRPEQLPFPVPEEVLGLITALLQPAPERRPSREALFACLHQALGASDSSHALGAFDPHFVGREPELRALQRAFESAKGGWLTVVDVSGESGIGKTELVRRFTTQVARRGALVVQGQCRMQESVAYQALDQVIDELSEYLLTLPEDERALLLGRDFTSLVQAFPVLGRVSPSAAAPVQLDAHLLQQRATTALCELLWRTCARQPVVLWIDDTHWGDAESERLLCDLLCAPAVPLLVILSRRQGPAPWALAVSKAVEQARGQWLALPVERLDAASSEALAAHLLGRLVEHRPGLARRVAAESAQVPLFIGQLCRWIAETSRADSGEPASPLTLREVIESRLLALTDEERRVTSLVALIETSLPLSALMVAAGLVAAETPMLSRLAAAKFLSLSGSRTETRVASFHHHVRETILQQLDATARERGHRLLASALEALGPSVEPEILLHHLIGAQATHHALALALRAAEAAMLKSAFAHAAALYRTALGLLQHPSHQYALVHGNLADALAAAGRTIEAGGEYLALARVSGEPLSVALQQRAAENFLVGGALEQGRAVLEKALVREGLPLPASRAGVVWHGLGQLARFELGRAGRAATGLPRRVDVRQALRADLCLSAAKGLGVVDPLLSAHFSFLALNVAQKAGDPARLASALCLSGTVLAALGGALGRLGEARLDEAEALAEASGDVVLRARGRICRGQV